MYLEPMPGDVGVNVTDERRPARLFTLTDEPMRMGVAYFAPCDDPEARVAFPLRDFWPLVDALK